MSIRIYELRASGGRGIALAAVMVGLGVVFVGFGVALLVVLGSVAAVVGAGVLLARRLMGRSVPSLDGTRRRPDLDPSLEIAADGAVVDREVVAPSTRTRSSLPRSDTG